nr:Holliday junction branch migration protein RuvA [Stutzerimonas kunmingensis]
MIGRITGTLLEKNPPQILVDVHGVGYEIDVPMSTFYNLPATGGAVSLHTHHVVREDGHFLFGFATDEERTTFRQLLKVSGVGARMALAVLSGLSVNDLAQAVALQEAGRLVKIPGIGKKTAERLLLELRDKLGKALPSMAGARSRRTSPRPSCGRARRRRTGRAETASPMLARSARRRATARRRPDQRCAAPTRQARARFPRPAPDR